MWSSIRQEISFGGLGGSRRTDDARRCAFFRIRGDDLTASNPKCSDEGIAKYFDVKLEKLPAAELAKETGAKSGCLLKISVKPGLPAGAFEQRIHVDLNAPERPEAEIKVDGKVNGPLEISGSGNWDAERGILMLGPIHSQEGAKAQLFVIVRGELRDRVEAVAGNRVARDVEGVVGRTDEAVVERVAHTDHDRDSGRLAARGPFRKRSRAVGADSHQDRLAGTGGDCTICSLRYNVEE